MIAVAWATYAGGGNPLAGVTVIGAGEDPISQAIAAAAETAVEWSLDEFPEQTIAVINALEAAGEKIDLTLTYVDEKTGNVVSQHWNELPEHTRNQIKGGLQLGTVAIGGQINLSAKAANAPKKD